MTEITHQFLWSSRSEKEHELIMRECERAIGLGGSFKIETKYTDNWYSFITIYYQETKP